MGQTHKQGKPIKKDVIPDIGCEVMVSPLLIATRHPFLIECNQVKKKDGKWYKGLIVKYERYGMSKMYAVKTLVMVLDRGAGTEKRDIPFKDVLLTGKTREVRSVPIVYHVSCGCNRALIRYWSSGTPCMRSSGFDYARKTTAEVRVLI